jgi:hypothetical protein
MAGTDDLTKALEKRVVSVGHADQGRLEYGLPVVIVQPVLRGLPDQAGDCLRKLDCRDV